MKFDLYQQVVLKVDVKKYKLKKGDVVTLVEYFPETKRHPAGYAVERFDAEGDSIEVLNVMERQIEKIPENAYVSIRKSK